MTHLKCLHSLAGLLALCLSSGCGIGIELQDDDDSAGAANDDDDDDFAPLEAGTYTGEASGVVVFTGAGTYECLGTAQITVTADERANGQVACDFGDSGALCEVVVSDLPVGAGSRALDLQCFTATSGQVQVWWDGLHGVLRGRYQSVGDVVSVEIGWASTQDSR